MDNKGIVRNIYESNVNRGKTPNQNPLPKMLEEMVYLIMHLRKQLKKKKKNFETLGP